MRASAIFPCAALLLTMSAAFATTPPEPKSKKKSADTEAPVKWPANNKAHQDIFCGAAGAEEASIQYSDALKRRLDELAKEGLSTAQAIERLKLSCAQ